VYWNDEKFEVTPTDYQIHYKKWIVIGYKGENTLKLVGTGRSDGRGSTISNIKLEEIEGDCKNHIKNGNFAKRKQNGGYNLIKMIYTKNEIPGWTG
jgi:hypothetical protein